MIPDVIRIAMIDDHLAFLDSFHIVFSAENGFEVVATALSAAETDRICRELRPDLILMDVCTENNVSGIDVLARLRPQYPDIKFVLMSGFDEMTYAARSKALGADGFIFKSKPLAFFLEVVRGVCVGKTYFPDPGRLPVSDGESPFTEREMEVLRLLCKNMKRHEIGQALNISEHTVNRHIEKMRAKGGYDTAFEMAITVVAKGWITPNY